MSGNNFELGANRMPGLTDEVAQLSRQFLTDHNHLKKVGIRIEADSVDAGHSGKTYLLRPGLALVRVETGGNKGKYVPADHADAPANSDVEKAVILMGFVDMRKRSDPTDTEDQMGEGLIHGFVDDAQIIYVDAGYKTEIQDALYLVEFMTEA